MENPSKKRRRQFPVAIAYFLTLIIGLTIFGVAGYFVIDKFVADDQQDKVESDGLGIPTAEDRYTMLYIQVDDFNEMNHALLVRMLPDMCSVKIVPISHKLLASEYEDDPLSSLESIYINKGVNGVKNAIENTMGISIDHYMTVTNGAFDNVVDYIGGVTIAPDEDLYYNDPQTGEQLYGKKGVMMTLDNTYTRQYINYPKFADGAKKNLEVMHDILPRFINEMFMQADNLSNNMDTFFNVIYNSSDTNITKNEYIKSKKGINNIALNVDILCESLMPTGEWLNNELFLSSDFPEKVKKFFEINQ